LAFCTKLASSVLLILLGAACASKPVAPPQTDSKSEIRASIAHLEADPDFVDVLRFVKGGQVFLDLRFANPRNFTGRELYGPLKSCYLHRAAAEKFMAALETLGKTHPELRVLIWDCLRPLSVQRALWKSLAGTTHQKRFTDPDARPPEGEGESSVVARAAPIESYGLSISASLADQEGRELDMGTDFGFFGEEAETSREKNLLGEGVLSETQLQNRKILRSTMEAAGFVPSLEEWWRFDALAPDQMRAHYRPVE
jgi:D-alanyl-D-alanine dipeptidase